jgi:hypothetical protein
VVVADAACEHGRHRQPIRRVVQARSAIPAGRGAAKGPMQGRRAYMCRAWPLASHPAALTYGARERRRQTSSVSTGPGWYSCYTTSVGLAVGKRLAQLSPAAVFID